MAQYNLRNPAVKRLMREAEELKNPTEEYFAQPVEDNLFEWHFTLRGPPNSEFEKGVYHGRISLPPDYPMKPPSIILLTPNGRFEVNKKICLSISGHHPESWQPSWSIRTALLAIIGFMPTHGNGAIGSLDYTPEERMQLAVKSQEWKCSECGFVKNVLKTKNEESSEHGEAISNEPDSEQEMKPKFDQNSISTLSFSNSNDLTHKTRSVVESVESQLYSDHIVSAKTASNESPELQNEIKNATLIQRRHLSSAQEEGSSIIVKQNENETRTSFFSLIVIWVISIILGLLIARRIFF